MTGQFAEQSQYLGEQVIHGLITNACVNADLVGHFLEATGIVPPRGRRGQTPVCLPKDFLLELSGILRLAWWEHLGLRHKLPDHLPAAAEALGELYQRWSMSVPKPTLKRPSLLQEVLLTWFTGFAWSGPEELHADVVLDEVDDHDLEALADFLWDHRHAGQTGD